MSQANPKLDQWNAYFDVLRKLGGSLEKLSFEQQKLNRAISVGDTLTVDETLKQQQALSLGLRGYEQKRISGLSELGIKSQKLSELVNFVPDELKQEAKKVSEQLRRQYKQYETAAAVAKHTIEINLHQIDLMQGGKINYNSAGVPNSTDGKSRADFTV